MTSETLLVTINGIEVVDLSCFHNSQYCYEMEAWQLQGKINGIVFFDSQIPYSHVLCWVSHFWCVLLQTLAMLLKKKRQLLNSHILHLTFSLVGTVDSGRESTVIPNRQAFEDLLCDLEVSLLLPVQPGSLGIASPNSCLAISVFTRTALHHVLWTEVTDCQMSSRSSNADRYSLSRVSNAIFTHEACVYFHCL